MLSCKEPDDYLKILKRQGGNVRSMSDFSPSRGSHQISKRGKVQLDIAILMITEQVVGWVCTSLDTKIPINSYLEKHLDRLPEPWSDVAKDALSWYHGHETKSSVTNLRKHCGTIKIASRLHTPAKGCRMLDNGDVIHPFNCQVDSCTHEATYVLSLKDGTSDGCDYQDDEFIKGKKHAPGRCARHRYPKDILRCTMPTITDAIVYFMQVTRDHGFRLSIEFLIGVTAVIQTWWYDLHLRVIDKISSEKRKKIEERDVINVFSMITSDYQLYQPDWKDVS